MPRIDDEAVTKKRNFKKKPYRPWNLLDDTFSPKAGDDESLINPTQEVITEEVVTPAEQPEIIKEPISNHLVTNENSFSNQLDTNRLSKVNKPESISNLLSNQISNHAAPKVVVPFNGNASNEVQRVTGLQRKILFYVVMDCVYNSSLISSPISSESLQEVTNADIDTTKTAVQRLLNKNLLQRGYGKRGKGGFSVYHVREEIKNAVIDAQRKGEVNTHLVTNKGSNKESFNPYSSGSYINTTTKEESSLNQKTDSPWDNIDIEPLTTIGFTRSHLKQIIMDDKLPADIVQDSIYAFAFDMDKNNKIKTLKSAPLNYFMGILRSGKPYAPPANYESPQDAAMRIYLERKKEAEQKRSAMEDEIFNVAFNEWESGLSIENKDSIYPQAVKNSRLSSEKTAHLRLYFRDQIWASKKDEYLMNQ